MRPSWRPSWLKDQERAALARAVPGEVGAAGQSLAALVPGVLGEAGRAVADHAREPIGADRAGVDQAGVGQAAAVAAASKDIGEATETRMVQRAPVGRVAGDLRQQVGLLHRRVKARVGAPGTATGAGAPIEGPAAAAVVTRMVDVSPIARTGAAGTVDNGTSRTDADTRRRVVRPTSPSGCGTRLRG